MRILRFLRIGFATIVALGSTLPATLVGCATRNKESDGIAPPMHGDPPPPVPPVSDSVHPVPPTLLFERNKSALSPMANAGLDELCAYLKKYPRDTITIEGHCSDTGEEEYNLALGLRRAEAAQAYLIEHGISADRIKLESHGETQPSVPNNSIPNRKLNQRVSFRYVVVD